MRAVEFVHGDDGGRATAVAIAQEAFEDWRAVSSCPGPTEARSSHRRLRAKSKTRNATLASQSRVLSQQPRSRVLEQRSSSLNPTLHNTEQRLPNKTPLCNLQSGLLLRKTPTKHVRAESSQCNTAQHSGSGQFPRRGCFRLPQSRSPSLLLFRAGLC